jgi:hypothetical protein
LNQIVVLSSAVVKNGLAWSRKGWPGQERAGLVKKGLGWSTKGGGGAAILR